MELLVKNRNVLGKKVKRLRRDGFVPAELFGHGVKNRHLSIPAKELSNIYKRAGSHTIVSVVTEEGEKIPVLISEIQHHPLSGKFLSAHLHQIRMDEMIEIKVPIEFRGIPGAEKLGFIVVKVLNEIEIKALPDKIPHSFEVDLSPLENLGESIHVSDLKFGEGVKPQIPKEMVIATVTEKAKEEVEVTPKVTEATPAAEAAAPEAAKTTEETPSETK